MSSNRSRPLSAHAATVAEPTRLRARTKRGGQVMWGYAGVWPGEFNMWKGDQTLNCIRFLADHGFESGHIGLREMQDPARRDEISQLVADHDLKMSVGVHFNWFNTPLDELHRQADAFLEDLRKYGDLLQTPIVITGAGVHRFVRSPSLEDRIDRLSKAFAPIAKGCHEMGRPFGIENHGDYYVEDLVKLCKITPHMGIFLDTGNTYLIGEKSVPACIEAAPYTIGTHFKDHFVAPNPGTLKFEIDGAPLGSGDVGLAQVYRALLDQAPGNLVLQWEMIPQRGTDAWDCLEQSWKFVRSLPRE
jgi:sugar phosphate isomerase/epimerase